MEKSARTTARPYKHLGKIDRRKGLRLKCRPHGPIVGVRSVDTEMGIRERTRKVLERIYRISNARGLKTL